MTRTSRSRWNRRLPGRIGWSRGARRRVRAPLRGQRLDRVRGGQSCWRWQRCWLPGRPTSRTRWSGVQADSYSMAAAADRGDAGQQHLRSTGPAFVQSWLTWLEQKSIGNDKGTEFSVRASGRSSGQPSMPGSHRSHRARFAGHTSSCRSTRRRRRPSSGSTPRPMPSLPRLARPTRSATIRALGGHHGGRPVLRRHRHSLPGRGVRLAMLAMAVLLFVGDTIFIFAIPQNVGI